MPAARCPMCHQANDELAWQCRRCGYEFGQPIEKLREMLHAQIRRSSITFWILMTFDLMVGGAVAYSIRAGHPVLPGVGFILVIWWTVNARQKISIARHSLELIDKQHAKLPKAIIHSKQP